MAYNYWIKAVFEEICDYEKASPERDKIVLQLSKVNRCYNNRETVHRGADLNLCIKIIRRYKGIERIREILHSNIFEDGKKYRIKKEIAKKLHSSLMN